MGGQSRHELGFPTNQVKGSDWRYSPGCGGMGAGSCNSPASYSFIYWSIKVNPFSVRNTKLVLGDESFAPYLDAGFDGTCSHSEGVRQAFDVLLFYSSPAAGIDRSLATAIINVPSSVTFPFDLEFDEVNLPQPDNPDYERKIWVAIDLGASGLMTSGRAQNSEALKTVKLNYEATP